MARTTVPIIPSLTAMSLSWARQRFSKKADAETAPSLASNASYPKTPSARQALFRTERLSLGVGRRSSVSAKIAYEGGTLYVACCVNCGMTVARCMTRAHSQSNAMAPDTAFSF